MDKKEALKKIKAGELSLEDVDKKLQADKEVVLVAVKQSGSALQYADKKIQADKEVVLAAIKQSAFALEHADKKLKADKEVVLLAVNQYGSTLEYADKKLKADKEVVLAALKKQDGSVLNYADKKLQADREVVLTAVKGNGMQLSFADEALKKDKDIVDAAIKNNPGASQFSLISMKSSKNKKTKPHRIYIKTEPGGHIAFGKLDDNQIKSLKVSLQQKKLNEDLEELRYDSLDAEMEGVFNTGKNGDFGNEGIITYSDYPTRLGPEDNKNKGYADGVYLVVMNLTKCSIEFEFILKEGFEKKKFEEVSVPIKLPKEITHCLYGHLEANIISDFKYDGVEIDEYEGEVEARGYERQFTFFEIKNGKTIVIYSNFNGEESWGK